MAKQIKWTNQAKVDRKKILDYFWKRNKSKAYSKKLDKIFVKEIKIILEFPDIGKSTNSENVRIKVSGVYFIIYQIEKEFIYILRIWDARQNPIKLKKRLKPK